MAKSDELFFKPQEVKTELEELQVMADLAGSISYKVLKRWVRRYTEKLKAQAFLINESEPGSLLEHSSYKNQAVGMEIVLRAIEGAAKKLEELEKENAEGL